jgi:hypothetical protein
MLPLASNRTALSAIIPLAVPKSNLNQAGNITVVPQDAVMNEAEIYTRGESCFQPTPPNQGFLDR